MIKGKVKSIRKDKMAFALENPSNPEKPVWYDVDSPTDVERGAEVSFSFEEYTNARGYKAKKVSGAVSVTSAAPAKPGFGAKKAFGKSPDEQKRICRQNALTNAVTLAAAKGGAASISDILKVAQSFADWTYGE